MSPVGPSPASHRKNEPDFVRQRVGLVVERDQAVRVRHVDERDLVERARDAGVEVGAHEAVRVDLDRGHVADGRAVLRDRGRREAVGQLGDARGVAHRADRDRHRVGARTRHLDDKLARRRIPRQAVGGTRRIVGAGRIDRSGFAEISVPPEPRVASNVSVVAADDRAAAGGIAHHHVPGVRGAGRGRDRRRVGHLEVLRGAEVVEVLDRQDFGVARLRRIRSRSRAGSRPASSSSWVRRRTGSRDLDRRAARRRCRADRSGSCRRERRPAEQDQAGRGPQDARPHRCRNEPVVVRCIGASSPCATSALAEVTGRKPRPRTARSVGLLVERERAGLVDEARGRHPDAACRIGAAAAFDHHRVEIGLGPLVAVGRRVRDVVRDRGEPAGVGGEPGDARVERGRNRHVGVQPFCCIVSRCGDLATRGRLNRCA